MEPGRFVNILLSEYTPNFLTSVLHLKSFQMCILSESFYHQTADVIHHLENYLTSSEQNIS